MRSWNGLRTWSKVIRDASSRYAAAPAYVPGMAASFSHGAVRRSSSDCSATVRAGGAVRSWDVDGLADELEALLLD